MKVVQAVPYFLPSGGGTERATLGLSRELVRLGHEVSIFAFNSMPSPSWSIGFVCAEGMPNHENVEGVEVFRFNCLKLGHPSSAFSLALSLSFKKARPDVVHLQGFFQILNLITEIVGSKAINVPNVLTVHGMNETLLMIDSSFSLYRHFLYIGLRTELKFVDRLIALSKKDEFTLKRIGVNLGKMRCIPNGVDLEIFGRAQVEVDIFEKYLIKRSRIILCVSRVARNKALHNLIIAAKILKERDDLFFLIIGSKSDKVYFSELTNMICKLGLAHKFMFLENVPQEDLVGFYKSSEIFVLPSDEETLPLVILEAMAAGCPVIATRVGGIPEIVVNEKSGILVRPSDPKEIAKWMAYLLDHEDIRASLVMNGRITAMKYSWKEIAKQTVEIYLSLEKHAST